MVKKPKYRAIASMFVSMVLAGVTQSPEAMAETREVKIIKNADDDFVFKDPAIEIKAGDTVRWIVTAGGVHRLLGDTNTDAFKDTGIFNQATTTPVEQTFKDTGEIHYHCFFHEDTMKGTIIVK